MFILNDEEIQSIIDLAEIIESMEADRETDPNEFLHDVLAGCKSKDLYRMITSYAFIRSEYASICDKLGELPGKRIDDLLKDERRLDWLADRSNNDGSVVLPVHIVMKNIDSMRGAIDETMADTKITMEI